MPKIECVAKGLTILARYPDSEMCASHEMISAGPDTEVDADDAVRLKALGWFAGDYGGWCIFT
jgi:hypothetical protein